MWTRSAIVNGFSKLPLGGMFRLIGVGIDGDAKEVIGVVVVGNGVGDSGGISCRLECGSVTEDVVLVIGNGRCGIDPEGEGCEADDNVDD